MTAAGKTIDSTMGEFSFRSASAVNINLQPTVGSVQQRTSKLQAAAAANATTQSRPKVNGSGNLRQTTAQRPSTSGKYRTTILLSETGPGVSVNRSSNHEEGHAERPQNTRRKAASTNGGVSTDSKAWIDMKGHPLPADEADDSFDPPPPLKFTPNGHVPSPGPVSPVSSLQSPDLQLPALTNGIEPSLDNGTSQVTTNQTHQFHIRELPPHNPEQGEASVGLGTEEHPFSVARDVKQPDTYKNELQIVSAKGTVRGFKNRVRAGIAVFRQQNDGAKVNKS